jgi:hypothetical protein
LTLQEGFGGGEGIRVNGPLAPISRVGRFVGAGERNVANEGFESTVVGLSQEFTFTIHRHGFVTQVLDGETTGDVVSDDVMASATVRTEGPVPDLNGNATLPTGR